MPSFDDADDPRGMGIATESGFGVLQATASDTPAMNTIAGLPAHPLLVHLAVVLIPLTGLLAVLTATWPAARRRLGVITPLVALVAVVVTPLTASAGESLEKQVPRTVLLHKHTEIGGQMNYWVAALFVVVVLFWAAHDDRLLARVPFPCRREPFVGYEWHWRQAASSSGSAR